MTAYFWSKACPGVYYLYDQPRTEGAGIGARHWVAKVERKPTGFYRITIFSGSQPPVSGPFTPASAMEVAERHLRRHVLDTFTPENF